jgi:hypothetical protein
VRCLFVLLSFMIWGESWLLVLLLAFTSGHKTQQSEQPDLTSNHKTQQNEQPDLTSNHKTQQNEQPDLTLNHKTTKRTTSYHLKS